MAESEVRRMNGLFTSSACDCSDPDQTSSHTVLEIKTFRGWLQGLASLDEKAVGWLNSLIVDFNWLVINIVVDSSSSQFVLIRITYINDQSDYIYKYNYNMNSKYCEHITKHARCTERCKTMSKISALSVN